MPSNSKTDGDGAGNLLSAQETGEQEGEASTWRYDYSYDNNSMPTGASLLLCLMGSVALLVSAVYLRASFRHERETKLSAYEQTVAEWTKFRPTFARLHINVTAHFGVAPVNTTNPDLDPDPPHPGARIGLRRSVDPDPIRDEEGPDGGLPDYKPLKYNQGIAPAPWRTAPRYPQPEDSEEEVGEESEDSEAEAATGTDPPSETNTQNDAGAHGDDGSGERQRRGLWWGAGDGGNKIEEDQGGAARDLPDRFVPASGFYDAPSVRFVFTAKLNPPAARGRRKRKKGNDKSNSKGGDQGQGQGQHRLDEVESQKEGRGDEGGDERRRRRELQWHRWTRRGSGGQDDTDGSLFVKMETGWTPLTRIREEHAPMPAPETKCMQVFGGVHNYKTKMCDVYERLSRVCVQVHIDESKGIIAFAPVVEDGSSGGGEDDGVTDGGGGGGVTDEGEEEEVLQQAPRYGCDPRTAWSPWRYTVLPVEGRTAIDVVPPATVSFVESLITVRSDLDPFLHAEALTYTPRQGVVPPGGDIVEDGGSGGGGTGGGKGVDPGAGGGSASEGGGGGGGEFLTFGLSSWSSAVVGCTFLAVGLLLLLQPTLALRRWWRRTAAADGGVIEGGGGDSDGGVVGLGGRGEKRPRGKQWSYGQVDSQWDEADSESSEGSSVAQREVEWARGVEWQRQPSGRFAMSPTPPDRKKSRDQPPGRGGLSAEFLRRRAGDVFERDEGGIQLGAMGIGTDEGRS